MCGVGEPGELLLSGPRLGRGYRGRPDLTADKFVPNPFYDTTADLPPEVRLHYQKVYHTGESLTWLDLIFLAAGVPRVTAALDWLGVHAWQGAAAAAGWLPGVQPARPLAEPGLPATAPGAGDLVRWGADGQLEFLGRIDRQVREACRIDDMLVPPARIHSAPGLRP